MRIYLAHPYQHRCVEVEEERLSVAASVAAQFISDGIVAYSPVNYQAGIANTLGVNVGEIEPPVGWLAWDKEMVEAADVLVILKMDGYKESAGVKFELEVALEQGIPIAYLEPFNDQNYKEVVEFIENVVGKGL